MADLCVGTMPDDMTDFVRQRMESQVFLAEIMDHSLRISNGNPQFFNSPPLNSCRCNKQPVLDFIC